LSREHNYTLAAEGLILGILIFAAVTYGAVSSWSIIVIHWATLALAVVTLLRRPTLPSGRLPGGWLNAPIVLLAVGVALSTAFSIYQYGSIRDALRIFNYIAVFYLVAINLSDRPAVIRFLTTMVVVAALLPFAGALQDWSRETQAGGLALTPESFKIGTFPNENHFAAFLVLVLPAGLGLAGYLARQRRWGWLAAIVACSGLGTVALMQTLTRAAWLGITLGLLAMLIVLVLAKAIPRERKLQATGAVLAVILLAIGLAPDRAVQKAKAVVAFGDAPGAMAFRQAVWNDSLPIIRDHALLGTGPRTFHLIYTQYRSTRDYLPTYFVDYLHNDYLQYSIEMGVPAAVALVAVLVFLIYHLGRHGAVAPGRSEFPIVLGILGSIVAFATAAFYSFELYITANGLLLWAMLAVGYRMLTFSEIAD
jgi:O-antigen ligase